MSWHPGNEQLANFRSGQLAPPDAAAVEQHLAECPTCKELVLGGATLPVTPAPNEKVQPGGAATEKQPPQETPVIPPELRDHPRYRILKLLGKGGMGAVFQAQHKLMERIVALKVISRSLIDNPASVERFRLEVKAAARLSHPNIVTAYDAEQVGDLHFLVMEYVEGRDLANVIRKLRGPLPVAHACEYVRQAAEGLQHAHEQGMVHRDVKPQNLMLTTKGQVKILDFGLARFASERETAGPITASGAIMGSPDFIAPEQVTDAHQADIRADIYSLGCTLYALLTARVPFPNGNAFDKMVQHTSSRPTPLEELRPEVPAEVVDAVNKMMAKDRRQRYQTPKAVRKALTPLIKATIDLPEKLKMASDSGPLNAAEPPPTEEAPILNASVAATVAEEPRRTGSQLRYRRRRWYVGVWTAAVFLTLAGSFWLAYQMIRATTDKATLEIRSDDLNVTVIVNQNGKQVRTVNPSVDKQVELRTGDYDLQLGGSVEGLRLSSDRVTLAYGDHKVLTVQRVPGYTAGPVRFTEIKRFKGSAQRIGEVAFAPDLRSVLTTDTSARLWEISSGRDLRHFDGHQAAIHDPSVSPDGQILLTPSRDGTVRLWDATTGKELRQLLGHQREVWGAALSPDGRLAVTGGFDHTVRLFDVATGKELRRFPGHAGAIASVVWSPDGQRILSCGNEEKAARIWDVVTGKELLRIPLPPDIRRAIFAPNGQQVLTVGKDHIVLWDAISGQEVRRFRGVPGLTYGAAFTPDGRHLVTGSSDGMVRLWSVATGQVLCDVSDEGEIYSVAVSRDGKMLLTNGGWTGVAKLYRLPPAVWPVPDKVGEVHRFAHNSKEGPANVTCLAYTPDGRRLLEGSDALPSLRLLDAESGQELYNLDGHNGWVNALAIAADGRWALTGSVDKQVFVWEMATGRKMGGFQGHKAEVVCAAFAPDQLRAATGDADGSIILWDLGKGQALRNLVGHAGMVDTLEFSLDGKRILSASNDKTIRLWDAETGKELWQFMGQGVQSAARFASSGKSVVAGGFDKVLRILDPETGKEVRAIEVPEIISYLCPLPDGKRVLLTHHDSLAVSLFDLETRLEKQRFRMERLPNRAIVSPDGRFAACGSFRGYIYVFRLPDPWTP